MENQTNVEDQNIQQIGQNPVNQPSISSSPEKPKINYWMISSILLLALLVGSISFYFIKSSRQKVGNDNSLIPTPTTETTQSSSITTPTESKGIVFPFVRSGSIYLYDNGTEKVLVSSSQKTTPNACYNIIYPFISPDKEYVAFIEQTGDAPGYGGCLEGVLKFVNLSSGKIMTTNYKTSYFSWNAENQIELESVNYKAATDNQGIDPTQSTAKFIIYDASTQKEVTSEVMKYSDRDAGIRGFPLYRTEKKIRFRDDKYYLVNNNIETYLFDKNSVRDFRGFSPDGKYAMFISTKQAPENSQAFSEIWYAVNTNNPSEAKKEILVMSGAAGGDFSTGLKWLFNDAFISYCSQHISFIDGRQPLELTNDGGGGCHNEEGFVSTSPNNDFAFLKFKDRFELRSKNGDIKKVVETTQLAKGRGAPKNLIWLDNDNMIIFQSAYGGGTSYPEPPKVYLFDRETNTVKPLVQNGYLIESSY